MSKKLPRKKDIERKIELLEDKLRTKEHDMDDFVLLDELSKLYTQLHWIKENEE